MSAHHRRWACGKDGIERLTRVDEVVAEAGVVDARG
jgi:hypothetical protein